MPPKRIGNEQLTLYLLDEGACPHQEDSRGRTPACLARRRDRRGSHAAVLHVLSTAARSAGPEGCDRFRT